MTIIPITNLDGSTNQIQVFDEGTKGEQFVLIFPAMGVRASFYESLALSFNEADIAAATVDLRGLGNSSLRPEKKDDFGYKDMIEQDYQSIINSLKKYYPNKKIYLLGHSLGGQLACLYTAKYKPQIEGIILIASCSIYYKNWTGLQRYKILFVFRFFSLLGKIFGYVPGKKVGFGGNEAKGVIQDWAHQGRSSKYEPHGDAFDYELGLKKLLHPILAISFEKDSLTTKAAVEHLLAKFNQRTPKTHHYITKDHPLEQNYNHFNWVKKPENIVGLVANWMRGTRG